MNTMSSTHTDLERQVWDLTRRVFELERHVGLRGEAGADAAPKPTTVAAPAALPLIVPPPVLTPPVAAAAVVEHVPATTVDGHASNFPPRPRVAEVQAQARPSIALPASPSRSTKTGPTTGTSLEQLVGGKLFAAIGAIVLVIGVGLALKLGVDRGWFSMSPAMRCIASTGFGAAMLALGHLIRRRWGVLASVGLSAAGIATMFVSVLAAYGWYNLLSAPAAFAAMVAVCAVGIGVSLSASSLAIAALSMVCAYATPLTLGDAKGPPAVVPMYLLGLLALGLVLAAWRPAVFRALRTVAWWGTVVVGTIWLFTVGKDSPLLALGFLGGFWLAIHAELVFGSTRLGEAVPTRLSSTSLGRRLSGPVIKSMSTTVWSVGMGILLLQIVSAPAMPMWMIPCAGTIGTLALGLMLAGTLRALVDAPETDLQRLGAALLVQAGGLAIVTIALGLSGWTMAVAWLGMGVASLVAGRWLKMRGLDVYGVVLLLLATGRLILWESWNAGGQPVGMLGLAVSRWSVLMLVGAGSWLAAAWVLSRGREAASVWRPLASVCVGLSAACVMGSLLVQGTRLDVVIIAWALITLAYAAGCGLSGRLFPAGQSSVPTAWVSVLAAVATSVMWLGVFLLDKEWWDYSGAAMSHPGFWIGLVVTAVWILLPLLAKVADKRAASILRAFGGALLLLASSLEIARSAEVLVPGDTTVHRAAVSVWWAVFGVGLILLGFARRIPLVRHAGLALMAVATFKGVIFDLAGVSAEWRVVTFLGLGVMMLGVAIAYARVSARMVKQPAVGGAGGEA